LRSLEIIESLPFVYFFFQVNVPRISQELVKLFLVYSVRSLNFPVKSRCCWLDLNVTYSFTFHMPMKLCLELMAIFSPDGLNTKRELFYKIINKVDRIF
jgi:hypothetical protein